MAQFQEIQSLAIRVQGRNLTAGKKWGPELLTLWMIERQNTGTGRKGLGPTDGVRGHNSMTHPHTPRGCFTNLLGSFLMNEADRSGLRHGDLQLYNFYFFILQFPAKNVS